MTKKLEKPVPDPVEKKKPGRPKGTKNKPVPDPVEKKSVGRPSKLHQVERNLTDNLIIRICNLIRIGSAFETASLAGGVRVETSRQWLTRANHARLKPEFERDTMDNLCISFQDEVNRAVADAHIRSLRRIDRAGKYDWKAEAWKLAHSIDPTRYGSQKNVEVHHSGTVEHQHSQYEVDVDDLPVEVVQRLYEKMKAEHNTSDNMIYLEHKENSDDSNGHTSTGENSGTTPS